MLIRKKNLSIIFVFFVIALISQNLIVNSQILITSIQSLDGSKIGPLSGSIQGGTRIRIKGSGFSTLAAQNHVFVGPYPCILLNEGATQSNLNCQTTRAYNSSQRWSLSVKVQVDGGPGATICTQNQCKFTYTSSHTPLIQQISPRTATGDQQISIWGFHRITDTGDQRSNGAGQIYSLMIDSTVCSTIDVIQGDQIDPNGRDHINCVVFKDQQAGQYYFKEHVKPGLAQFQLKNYQTSLFTGKNYTQRVASKITNNPFNTGGSLGHNIQLKGLGFSKKPQSYTCTVAGQQCKVTNPQTTSITVQIPPLDPSNTNFGALNKDASDLQTQQKKFLGSNGFRYTRYPHDLSKNPSEWFTYLRGTHTLVAQADQIRTELSSTQLLDYKYVQYWRGYFYAPKDGQYNFGGMADDGFGVQISKVQNNANLANLQDLINAEQWSSHHFNPFYTGVTTQYASRNLTQGYYYMQIVSYNGGGKGHFRLIVDTPQIHDYTTNPTWQIDEFIIMPQNVIPEQIEIKVNKNVSVFKLSYNVKDDTIITVYSNSFNKGASAKEMKDNLWRLPFYGGDYKPQVSLITVDIAGVQTTTPADIQNWIYTLKYYKYRNPISNMQRTLYSDFAIIRTVTNHSVPITGTYSIMIGNDPLYIYSNTNQSWTQTAIPYNTPSWKIQDALNNYYNTSNKIDVSMMKFSDFDDSIMISVEYIGVLGTPYPLTFDISTLLCGTTNQFTFTSTTRRQFSNTRPLYTPLPLDFMRTAQSLPQIYLTLNKIPIICPNCAYQFNPTKNPTITSASLSSNTLTLSLSDPGNIAFSLSDMRITLNNIKCNSISGTLTSLTCKFGLNSINQAELSAGNQKPKIHIAQVGYADTTAITSIPISLVVNSITPIVTGTNGGVLATLIGKGFPVNIKNSVYSMQICGNKVISYQSVSNNKIQFILPKGVVTCTSSNSILTVNGITQTITGFTYDPTLVPSISLLSKSSSSPILKSTLTITGTGFSTIAKTKVFLIDSNNIRQYELTIINMTTTQINCILGGGKTAAYNVVIVDQMYGESTNNVNSVFNYQIIVESITPITGSLGGGYDITITGKNFADPSSHTVFVGNAQNTVCIIKSATSTQIICTVPRIDQSYTSNTPLQVIVTGRLLQESICKGTCSFSYLQNLTNNVTIPNITKYTGGTIVTIQGTDLTGATVTVGNIPVTLTTTNSTTLSFSYPALKYGDYQIKILTPSGYTHPKIMSTTNLAIYNTLSRISGSLNGHRVTVSCSGLPNKVDKYLSVKLLCANYSLNLPIISVTPRLITFQTVKSDIQQTCGINVTYQTTFRNFQYSYRVNQTGTSTITTGSGINTYTLTTNFTVDRVQYQFLSSTSTPTTSIYTASVTKINNTTYTIKPTDTYFPSGKFRIIVHTTFYGYHTIVSNVFTSAWSANPTSEVVQASFLGRRSMKLTGSGFIDKSIQNNQILVCGLKARILSVSSTQLNLQVPPLVTSVTQSLYNLAKPQNVQKTAQLISDNPNKANLIIDGNPSTFYQSTNQNCFIGFNFGSNTKVHINSIKFMPNPAWAVVANYLENAKFQGSNDGTTWTTIFTIDINQVHSSWNYWPKPTGQNIEYQYVRFSHNNISNCQISDIQINGIVFSTLPVTSTTDKQCDIIIKGPTDINISNAITYKHSKTSTMTQVTPKFGPSIGGTSITITGTNFGTNINIIIDDIACGNIVVVSSTTITCTTGKRATIPSKNSFIITSDSNPVLNIGQSFNYIDRWSNQQTWGGQSIPRQNDSVYVPKGMSLLVDVPSTPILNSIIVQGRIIFADQIDMTLDTHYFIINNGQFIAGTQQNRYNHKLTITLHGGYFDKQLPIFGNKVLGCRNCKFSLHGKVRIPTWTQLANTILPGATTFSVLQAVDWVAGEHIVVASSSFDHYQSEQRIILSVSVDKKTITVTQAFKYKHYSAIQMYGTVQFPMRSQVALLTRNIKVQGNSQSQQTQYGSHMMMNGRKQSGLVASFSYAEFTKCGQPKIVGRYCTHFHMTGQMPDSSVRGLAVHHSYARVLTIHGAHFLLVQKNVGYHVKGHNIFIQDGIQTNNVIQDNLMISSIVSLTMLQSDITVASYWVTNPYNTVRRNRAAGSDFYGFWYEIKQHPDGPSATSDVCPMGMQLGQSKDNIAHSNVRFGLRIFKLSARKYPCNTTKDQSLADPYSANQAIHSVFENYILWRNAECGFLGEQLGYTTIRNFKTVDSIKGGMQFHKTNFTKQLVIAQNCLIVGYSQGNAPTDINTDYNNARGFIASRTDGLMAKDISFYNFGTTMTPLQSCSECYHFKLWVVGSKTTMFKNISYSNIQGNYIFWQKWRRQIFMDLDGSLLKPLVDTINPAIPAQKSGSITPYRPSVMVPNHCYQISGPKWNHSTYCDSTVQLRSILFTNGIPKIDFNAIDMKSYLLSDPYDNFTLIQPPQTKFSQEYMIIIKKSMDIKNSWAMPFVVGKYHNVHWKLGMDFTHMAIAPSRLWNDTEGTVLRFNYTDQRQLFQIGKYYSQALQRPLITPKTQIITPATCQNGDYFHDRQARYLFVCVSGRNKTIQQWIDVNGIRCLNFCPSTNPDGQRQNFQRYWSDIKNWPNGKPQAGENVTIPYQWNLILDQPTPIFKYVQVNGLFIFDTTKNHTFQAHYIWVKKGTIKIGAHDKPYENYAQIILHGQKDDRYLVLDPDASGNKMLAVTGSLQFYGNTNNNVWTKLTKIAVKGSTTIDVINATGWKIGDKIVIAPTYDGQTQFQKVTITQVNGNTITFTPALLYEHYGASAPIVNSYGTIDTRGGVGLLTRNIRITNGSDANNWGCRVLVYSYDDIPEDLSTSASVVTRTGKVTFKGVQIDGCGQYDSTYAGLRIEKVGTIDNNWLKPNIIQSSSIHSCNGICSYISTANNILIDNNVFFNAKKFLIFAQITNNYTVTNNLLIGATKRKQLQAILTQTIMVDDVSCYEQYHSINYDTDNVTVTKNLAQGSEGGQGFVFPFAPCEKLPTYNFGGNTAGSTQVAFMFQKIKGYSCIGASKLVGYASHLGTMANPTLPLEKMIYEDVLMVDNTRGITLRYAQDDDDNTMIVRNSYFAGYSRPECPNCYSDKKLSRCKGGYAIRMFSATITGQSFPLVKKNIGFDVICTRQSFDMKSFFNNVTFENYQYNNEVVPYCSNMAVFKRHSGASDASAPAYLTNSPCVNCDRESFVYFDAPNPVWRGWFGGCGQLDCTGPNNYFIHDQDGTFTGSKSQIISNNSFIGNNQQSCTYIPEINGHHCLTEQFAVLEYESIAPDFNKRIMWPVYLKYDTGNWTSVTNGWKQWQWDGPQPMNLRLARFVSIIKLHQNYNLSYSSQPPADSRFQIQKRLLPTGNSNDWAIIRIFYPLPNSIQVLVKNSTGRDIVIKPFPLYQGQATNLRNHVDFCGANNFHFQNGTIQFVVNGRNNCQVRVRLTSYIKLTTRLSIPVADFYTNNGLTTFITNICAFLGIDTGRLKIVGVRSGSTIVDYTIQNTNTDIQTSTTTTTDKNAQAAQLQNIANKLTTGMTSGTVNVGAPVVSTSANVVVINTDGTINTVVQNDETSKNIIIILAVVIPITILIIVFAGYCYIKRRRERVSAVQCPNSSQIGSDFKEKMSNPSNPSREMIKVSEIPFEFTKRDTIQHYY